jgi:F5/8 type C domain
MMFSKNSSKRSEDFSCTIPILVAFTSRKCSANVVLTCFAFAAALVATASGTPVPIPGNAPVAVDRLRVNNPAILQMTGSWKFQITGGKEKDGNFVEEFNNVTASCEQHDHRAVGAFGGEYGYWSSSNNSFPQWWQVDFGKMQQLQSVRLTFEDGGLTYQGQIEGSPDCRIWTSLANLKQASSGERIPITPMECRYLRITFTDGRTPQNQRRWAVIRHIDITILQNGQEVAWTHESASKNVKLKNFFRTDFDDNSFSTIPVPSNWEVLGYSRPT